MRHATLACKIVILFILYTATLARNSFTHSIETTERPGVERIPELWQTRLTIRSHLQTYASLDKVWRNPLSLFSFRQRRLSKFWPYNQFCTKTWFVTQRWPYTGLNTNLDNGSTYLCSSLEDSIDPIPTVIYLVTKTYSAFDNIYKSSILKKRI